MESVKNGEKERNLEVSWKLPRSLFFTKRTKHPSIPSWYECESSVVNIAPFRSG